MGMMGMISKLGHQQSKNEDNEASSNGNGETIVKTDD